MFLTQIPLLEKIKIYVDFEFSEKNNDQEEGFEKLNFELSNIKHFNITVTNSNSCIDGYVFVTKSSKLVELSSDLYNLPTEDVNTPWLESLQILEIGLRDEELKFNDMVTFFEKTTHLHKLCINESHFSLSELDAIKLSGVLGSVTDLELSTQWENTNVATLFCSKMPQLLKLRIELNTMKEPPSLRSLTNLKKLSVVFSRPLSIMNQCSFMEKLETLNLITNSEIVKQDSDIDISSPLLYLFNLSLTSVHLSYKNIVTILKNTPNLRSLTLIDVTIDGPSQRPPKLPHLMELKIAICKVESRFIEELINQTSQLQTLNIQDLTLTLGQESSLKYLTNLELKNGDTILDMVPNIDKLKNLSTTVESMKLLAGQGDLGPISSITCISRLHDFKASRENILPIDLQKFTALQTYYVCSMNMVELKHARVDHGVNLCFNYIEEVDVATNTLSNAMPSQLRIDTNTDRVQSKFNVIKHYEGVPNIHPSSYRHSFYRWDCLEKALIKIVPSYIEMITVPKINKSEWPQRLKNNYDARFIIIGGASIEIDTISPNTEFLFYQTVPSVELVFKKDPTLGAYKIEYEGEVSGPIKIYARCSNRYEKNDLKINLVPTENDSDFQKAFTIIYKKMFPSSYTSLSIDKFKNDIQQRYQKMIMPWFILTNLNLEISILTLTENEKSLLQLLFSKSGCCRHSASLATSILTEVYNTDTLMITNESHAFSEVTIDGRLCNMDFGGAPSIVTISDELFELERVPTVSFVKENSRSDLLPAYTTCIKDSYNSRSLTSLEDVKSSLLMKGPILIRYEAAQLNFLRPYLITHLANELHHVRYIDTDEKIVQLLVLPKNIQENMTILVNWNKIKDKASLLSIVENPSQINSSPLFVNVISLVSGEKISTTLRRRHAEDVSVHNLLFPLSTNSSEMDSFCINDVHKLDLMDGALRWQDLLEGHVTWDNDTNSPRSVDGLLSRRNVHIQIQNPPKSEGFDLSLEEYYFNKHYISATVQDGEVMYTRRPLVATISIDRHSSSIQKEVVSKCSMDVLKRFRNDNTRFWVVTTQNYLMFKPQVLIGCNLVTL